MHEMIAELQEAAIQIAGSLATGSAERERWREVGQILREELTGAAGRAEYVSSVPAFFAEHLRRRFTKRPEALARPASSQAQFTSADQQSEAPVSLTDEQIKNMAEMILELMRGDDYSIEAVTQQFAANVTRDDWSKVLALVTSERTAE